MSRLRIESTFEIPKAWGRELILINDEKYCGKILEIKSGCQFSMHFHIKKDETWYIRSGLLVLKYIDTSDASSHELELKQGDVVRVAPGCPHQLRAIEDSEIFEVSTTHQDTDSFRVAPGDSQKPS